VSIWGSVAGLLSWARGAKSHSLWSLFDLGRWDELLEVAEELVSWDRSHGSTYWGPWGLSYQVDVLVRRGDVARAAEIEEELLSRAREIGDPQVLAPALVAAALVEQARGGLPAALALMAEFESVTDPMSQFRLICLPDAVRICVAAGGMGEARSLISSRKSSFPRRRFAVLTARAVLAEATGDLGESLSLYSNAATSWREFGVVVEHGFSLLGLGRCLFRLGEPREAVGPLGEAREIFRRLGARPLVTEAETILGASAAASGS
jgi:tetratricopeptide (TPR) repeat protein